MTCNEAPKTGPAERQNEEKPFIPYNPLRYMTQVAQEIQQVAIREWGPHGGVTIVGQSPQLAEILRQIQKISTFDEPVLITGESGSGKESLAQALHLLSARRAKRFTAVNCPQYSEGNLTASEFFGHKRGSFTGAVADRRGAFEEADGGAIFLDEVGDLQMSTQVMLLRALATGVFSPVGSTAPTSVNVRVISATNRNLQQMRGGNQFREDLFYRLSFFRIEVPPLRERADDWAILADYFLRRLSERHGVSKTFSSESMKLLSRHSWPGNVRELASIVTVGYAMSEGWQIEPRHFAAKMERCAASREDLEEDLWREVRDGDGDFWTTVYQRFMDRDLNRFQVRAIVSRGLMESHGSFRKLLKVFHLPADDYQKFMDCLRHNNLKPQSGRD